MVEFQSTGVVATAKHFPNLGDSQTDSHYEFVVINKTWEQLTSEDLLPFIENINRGIIAIMPGYAKCPQIDSIEPRVPFSKVILKKLRTDLKFNGLIVSDIVLMGGLQRGWKDPWDVYATKAIMAGHDLVVVRASEATRLTDYMCHFLDEDSPESRELASRIDESYDRIMAVKERTGVLSQNFSHPLTPNEVEESFANQKLNLGSTNLSNALGRAKKSDYLSIALVLNKSRELTDDQIREWTILNQIYSSSNRSAPPGFFQCPKWQNLLADLGGGNRVVGSRLWVEKFKAGDKVPFPAADSACGIDH